MKNAMLLGAALLATAIPATSQVNSGSNGSDGAFNPTQNVEIDMADHPDGIYHYTSVNIPSGVTVTYKPNAANTPVVWLVQSDCIVSGTINISGKNNNGIEGGQPGPGGFRGGRGPLDGASDPESGQGPGGGKVTPGNNGWVGSSGSFGTVGGSTIEHSSQHPAGDMYGSPYLVPLIGGSGGGGGTSQYAQGNVSRAGGGGGGGAILIAAANIITINGAITANGGSSDAFASNGGGGGSGGAVRLIASVVNGNGTITSDGGRAYINNYYWWNQTSYSYAGLGTVRIDALNNNHTGSISAVLTRGFQPIVLQPQLEQTELSISSVGGIAVANNPTGLLTNPDVIVPANQQNPVSIVVGCTNIPLGTEIIVDVKSTYGQVVRAVGMNNIGTQASSTATVQVQMPRGGGTIQAKAISGIQLAANDDPNAEHLSLAQTGWTADGERFKAFEVTGGLGVSSQLAYITESGKRYTLGSR
jgi:hypothetical protein